MLNFLIDLQLDFAVRDSDLEEDEDNSKLYIVSNADFQHAISLGRTSLLTDILARTGHGIPVQRLIKNEVQEKPKVSC